MSTAELIVVSGRLRLKNAPEPLVRERWWRERKKTPPTTPKSAMMPATIPAISLRDTPECVVPSVCGVVVPELVEEVKAVETAVELLVVGVVEKLELMRQV